MTLRACRFTLDALSVEGSSWLTGTIFFSVIGRVLGINVLSHTASAGVGAIGLKRVLAVLCVELLIPLLLQPGLLSLDGQFTSLVIARHSVFAFAQADVHTLLAVPLGSFPVLAYRDTFIVILLRWSEFERIELERLEFPAVVA